jgi:hypothetical protein
VGKDTKIKEMERSDCENYFHNRTKNKKKLPVGRTTVLNEQSSVNAMMSWLHRSGSAKLNGSDKCIIGVFSLGKGAGAGDLYEQIIWAANPPRV